MTVERMHIGWRFWLKWLLASVVGFFLGGIVAWVAAYEVGHPMGSILFVAAPGAGVAIMQWLIVRRHVSGARRWALARMLGLGVTAVVGTAVIFAAGYSISDPGLSIFIGFAGLVWLGAVTGLALVWLLRQPAKEA